MLALPPRRRGDRETHGWLGGVDRQPENTQHQLHLLGPHGRPRRGKRGEMNGGAGAEEGEGQEAMATRGRTVQTVQRQADNPNAKKGEL